MAIVRFLRRRWWLLLLAVAALALAAFALWVGNPLQPLPEALAALEPDAAVSVDTSPWLAFAPASPPEAGLIVYPGGLVEPRAYAPLARAVAEAGYLAVIVPMPLNLAIANVNAAHDVMAAYPDIRQWAIAGHSLGGSMAARFAHDNPGAAAALILLSAYPDRDLSGADLVVASIYGERDGLATTAQVEGSASLLPPGARFVKIAGGNHAYMGWYGEQPRDNPAAITREEQQRQVLEAILDVLAALDAV